MRVYDFKRYSIKGTHFYCMVDSKDILRKSAKMIFHAMCGVINLELSYEQGKEYTEINDLMRVYVRNSSVVHCSAKFTVLYDIDSYESQHTIDFVAKSVQEIEKEFVGSLFGMGMLKEVPIDVSELQMRETFYELYDGTLLCLQNMDMNKLGNGFATTLTDILVAEGVVWYKGQKWIGNGKYLKLYDVQGKSVEVYGETDYICNAKLLEILKDLGIIYEGRRDYELF